MNQRGSAVAGGGQRLRKHRQDGVVLIRRHALAISGVWRPDSGATQRERITVETPLHSEELTRVVYRPGGRDATTAREHKIQPASLTVNVP